MGKDGQFKCTKCKELRPVDDFGKDKSRNDGRARTCCHCRRVKVRKCWKGRVSTFKGKHHSDEAKRKLSESHKGLRLRLGKKHSDETRKIISEIVKQKARRGSDNPNWKGGISALRHGDRVTPEYRAWRRAVFERDDYTCQICTVYLGGGDLEAHHIKSYAKYPELRYDVENGVTLCNYHHQREVHDGKRY